MVSVCLTSLFIFFVKQKTAYEMRISDWSSDVCSSDLAWHPLGRFEQLPKAVDSAALSHAAFADVARHAASNGWQADQLLIDVTRGFEGAQDLFAIARAEGVRPTLLVDLTAARFNPLSAAARAQFEALAEFADLAAKIGRAHV